MVTEWDSAGSSGTRPTTPPTINARCVNTKTRNTGASAMADSLAPRRFNVVRHRMNRISSGIFMPIAAGGRKLKIASPAAAIDTVIVKM